MRIHKRQMIGLRTVAACFELTLAMVGLGYVLRIPMQSCRSMYAHTQQNTRMYMCTHVYTLTHMLTCIYYPNYGIARIRAGRMRRFVSCHVYRQCTSDSNDNQRQQTTTIVYACPSTYLARDARRPPSILRVSSNVLWPNSHTRRCSVWRWCRRT